MKKTMMAATLVLSALSIQSALAAEYSEKTQYLGVVNGQVVGNSVVKVTRTPTDPVLYRSGDTMPLPDSLTIRNAESRAASGGLAYITVKQVLPDNGEARTVYGEPARAGGRTAVNLERHAVCAGKAVPPKERARERT